MAESLIVTKKINELKQTSAKLESLINGYLDKVDASLTTELSLKESMAQYEQIVNAFNSLKESAHSVHLAGLASIKQIGTPNSLQDASATDLPSYTDMIAEMSQLENTVKTKREMISAGIQLTANKS